VRARSVKVVKPGNTMSTREVPAGTGGRLVIHARGPDGLADDWQVGIRDLGGLVRGDWTDRRSCRLLCHGPAEEARFDPIVSANVTTQAKRRSVAAF
jgi:hypothetical protein